MQRLSVGCHTLLFSEERIRERETLWQEQLNKWTNMAAGDTDEVSVANLNSTQGTEAEVLAAKSKVCLQERNHENNSILSKPKANNLKATGVENINPLWGKMGRKRRRFCSDEPIDLQDGKQEEGKRKSALQEEKDFGSISATVKTRSGRILRNRAVALERDRCNKATRKIPEVQEKEKDDSRPDLAALKRSHRTSPTREEHKARKIAGTEENNSSPVPDTFKNSCKASLASPKHDRHKNARKILEVQEQENDNSTPVLAAMKRRCRTSPTRLQPGRQNKDKNEKLKIVEEETSSLVSSVLEIEVETLSGAYVRKKEPSYDEYILNKYLDDCKLHREKRAAMRDRFIKADLSNVRKPCSSSVKNGTVERNIPEVSQKTDDENQKGVTQTIGIEGPVLFGPTYKPKNEVELYYRYWKWYEKRQLRMLPPY